MKKLSSTLFTKCLLTIHKSDIIYDKPLNESFKNMIEMLQYNAAIMRACAIKVVSRDKLYQELVFESLADWRWSGKLISFNKIIHCVKSVRIWSYSGPHFPRIFPHSDMEYLFVFSLNTGK